MIGIVGCSATKLDRPALARDLYDSHLFRMSLRYAEAKCTRVYVLSALCGLVELDSWIMPYQFRLEGSKRERQVWGERIAGRLIARHGRDVDYLFLAGEDYAGRVATGLRIHDGHREDGWHGVAPERIHQPLAKMQIGQRLAWLKAQIAQLPPPPARRPWREVLAIGPSFDELRASEDDLVAALSAREREAHREVRDAYRDACEELCPRHRRDP